MPALHTAAVEPDGILICHSVAEQLQVAYANPRCRELLGLAPSTPIEGQPLEALLAPWLAEPARQALHRAVAAYDPIALPLTRHIEGHPRRLRLSLRKLSRGGAPSWIGSLRIARAPRDLVIERADLVAHRGSAVEQQLRARLDALPLMLLSADTEGQVTDANCRWLDALGFSRDAVIGRAVREFACLDTDESSAGQDLWPRLQEGARDLPCLLLGAQGQRIAAALSVHVEHGSDGRAMGATLSFVDFSAQQRAWRVLKQHELSRIAHDLHDGLGQELAGAAMMLKALTPAVRAAAPGLETRLSAVSATLDRAMSQTRALAKGLSPVRIGRGGLQPALTELVENCRSAHGVAIELSMTPEAAPRDAAAALDLYRIAQEALNNAIKHAQARTIRISLEADSTRTVLQVVDDGIGLGAPSGKSEGLGLEIMRHRAQLIGASLGILDRAGGGTIVKCTLRHHGPVEQAWAVET